MDVALVVMWRNIDRRMASRAAIVLAAVVATGCSGSGSASPTTSTSPPPPSAAATTKPPAPADTSTPPTSPPTPPTSSTSTSTSTSTSPVVARAVAAPAPSGSFSEDFADPHAFADRFDHGWSGQDPATWDASSEPFLEWIGDHDMNCGKPAQTHRAIKITPGLAGKQEVWYQCAPGGDPAKAHLMTSVQTRGYNIAWFTPKQTFTDVKKVCWSQNLTDLGGGKWTQMVIEPVGQVEEQKGDMGLVDPDFWGDPKGPGAGLIPDPAYANVGARMMRGGFELWDSKGWVKGGDGTSISTLLEGFEDKAARFPLCVADNGDGTVTLTMDRPDGAKTARAPGKFPTGEVRVVFEDDSYNPNKHFNAAEQPPDDDHLTWHWDDIQITAG
jgi:hypothetical protein